MRRVVTGHDASGKSVFASDGEPPHGVALRGVPRFRIDEVWSVVAVPTLPPASAKDSGSRAPVRTNLRSIQALITKALPVRRWQSRQ